LSSRAADREAVRGRVLSREGYRPVEKRAVPARKLTLHNSVAALPTLRVTDALVARCRTRFNRLKFSRIEASQMVMARKRGSHATAENLGNWGEDTRPRWRSGSVVPWAAVPSDGYEMPRSSTRCRHTRQRLLALNVHGSSSDSPPSSPTPLGCSEAVKVC
jgi:hypothetical protein